MEPQGTDLPTLWGDGCGLCSALGFQECYCRDQPDAGNVHFPSLLFFLSHICATLSSGKRDKPVIAALKHFSSPLDVPSLPHTTH